MGFIVLGITGLVISIGLLIFLTWYLDDYEVCLVLMFMVMVSAFLSIFYGLTIACYELDGSYTLIQDSNGDYVSRKENGDYVMTINENGIPCTHSFSDLKIVFIETDENAKLKIVKGNWSIEETVYIPKSNDENKDKQY